MRRAEAWSPFDCTCKAAPPNVVIGRVVRSCILLMLPLVSMVCSAHGQVNRPIVGPRVRVSPPLAGNHSLMDLALDPDHPGTLFACGYRFAAPENAMMGFVYRSRDGGHSWREILKDESSAWVSEESCAAGGERVFFMAERAILEHGRFASGLPLQKQGEIHLRSSLDEGNKWASFVQRGWLDHTAMAVDWTHGPRRGQMYLFGQASRQIPSGYLDEIQLITSDDGSIHKPVSAPTAKTLHYRGAYASSARVLPGGSVLAVYQARRNRSSVTKNSEGLIETYVEVFGTSDGGRTLAKRAEFGPIHPCLGAIPAMDVNRKDGRLYVVWGNMQNSECQLSISSTRDEGLTWSAPRTVVDDGLVPAIAVNQQGIVGLLWLETGKSQCWKFAASIDGAQTFSNPVQVSRCLPTSPIANLSQSARDASSEVHCPADSSSWKLEPEAIGFSVIAAKDGLVPDRTGLTTEPSGVFHAIWPEPTDQGGALWSTNIVVGGAEPVLPPTDSRDISAGVVLEFSNPEFEPESGVYALDVTVINVTDAPMQGPLLLRLDGAYSRYFRRVSAIGSDNAITEARPVWTIWPRDSADVLGPGKSSSPRRLSFRLVEQKGETVNFGDLLSVKLTALSAP